MAVPRTGVPARYNSSQPTSDFGQKGHSLHICKPPYIVAPTVISLNPRARLLVELPANRYRILSSEGRVPRIGDLVFLDQGFTGADGLPMVLAYYPSPNAVLYEAEIYETELG